MTTAGLNDFKLYIKKKTKKKHIAILISDTIQSLGHEVFKQQQHQQQQPKLVL